ncbi:histone deacetylase family protein [Methylocella sp.]|uniref:histone deacetylase family protein n=1 Tax=Methylocella sp. TaxID=1978226 RepID=UPI0035B240A8
MGTLFITHPACLLHLVPLVIPETPARLRAVERGLSGEDFRDLRRAQAPLAEPELALLAHTEAYVRGIEAKRPEKGFVYLDSDTVMSPGTWEAAMRALGAARLAVDEVASGGARNAFVAARPPGHHAEPERAMGFCLFNAAVIAARHAQRAHGLKRVAICDFDVHHGNGTQVSVWSDPTIFYASTHQMPLFPGTGRRDETGAAGTILNVPMRAGDGGGAFREAYERQILPALDAFAPEMLIVSAGFDAHKDDPLANLELVEADFAWMTKALAGVAAAHCSGRLVSILEGGYNLEALSASAAAHVRELMA